MIKSYFAIIISEKGMIRIHRYLVNGSGSWKFKNIRIRILEAQKHPDPDPRGPKTDPDPKHWFFGFFIVFCPI
jgi:hypothetical protein